MLDLLSHFSSVTLLCGRRNLSHVKQLGPATVAIAVDVRSERSREVLLPAFCLLNFAWWSEA